MIHIEPTPVLRTALAQGGDYADLYAEHTTVNSLQLMDGVVSQGSQSVLHGVGVRVLKGERTGYAYTMDTTPAALTRCAQAAACIADSPAGERNIPLPVEQRLQHNLYPIQQPWEEMGVQQRIQVLLRIQERAMAGDPSIIRVNAALSERCSHIYFANSVGEAYRDIRPLCSLVIRVVMQRGQECQQGVSTRQMRMGAEFITDALLNEMIVQATDSARFLFEAIQPQGGDMPVVMTAGGSGILLHEAIGHAFEADFCRKGTSIFASRMGEQICHPCIDIVDDGTMQGDAGALHWDDEGVTGQCTPIVTRGRLTSYLHDRISAKHYGVAPTGNGRRESFRHIPVPRMRNTYMHNGEATPQDIISHVRRGIYARRFTNGQVQIGAGDFTFYMKEGYLIEDGKLTRPIRDVNIIGNGPKALADISMVGNDLLIDHSAGMCGKAGQSVPVSQGLPTILINHLVVG